MSTSIFHRLVGYDRATQRVAAEHDISDHHLDFVKRVAGVARDDPEAALCYRLNSDQVREIAAVIGITIDADAFNFYLEGFAAPLQKHAG
jgi:hypothetical protein